MRELTGYDSCVRLFFFLVTFNASGKAYFDVLQVFFGSTYQLPLDPKELHEGCYYLSN